MDRSFAKLAVYEAGIRVPRVTGLVTVFSSGVSRSHCRRLVRRIFGPDAKEHRRLALFHWNRAKRYQALYDRSLDIAAMKTLGRPFTFGDYRISGIGRDEFGEDDKARLRRYVRLLQAHRDVARAHACAAGRPDKWSKEIL